MKTKSSARRAHLGGLFACLTVAALGLWQGWCAAETPGAPVIVGVVLPQVKLDQGGGDLAEAVRQSLIPKLSSAAVHVLPLSSPEQADAEAAQKHCDYVLYTQVEQKHGMGSMLRKLAPLASLVPLGAAGGRMGGGAVAQAAGQVAQNAAANAAAASQQQVAEQMLGIQHSSIKRGDTVTLDYRLTAVGGAAVAASGSLKARADADSQDVLNPLVEQLTGVVSSTLTAGSNAASRGVTASDSANSSTAEGKSDQHQSMFGGLFGHKSSNSQPVQPQGNQQIDCSQIAKMPYASMSLEDCQKMQGAQQAYNQAANDPSAARAGDDQMTCDQIVAELKQQQYSVPDKDKVAQAQTTLSQHRAIIAKHQAEIDKMRVEEQAQIDAASAADTATEVTTGGLVRGRSVQAVQKTIDARNKAAGERMAAEQQPTEQKMNAQVADFSAGAGQQLQANPRLARLMQLAQTRRCKGG